MYLLRVWVWDRIFRAYDPVTVSISGIAYSQWVLYDSWYLLVIAIRDVCSSSTSNNNITYSVVFF